ncbi:MAG TPA: hypothetical protein VGS96_06180 [Thermoanaerobaculia bacterium]|jgi:hypothetical protein|nr:hypothetical protein [Thermoanaerobaculia bacterium]
MRLLERLVATALWLVLFLSCAGIVQAQGTLTVSPAVLELRGTVGQSTTQPLTMSNATDRAMTFEMKAKDLIVRNGHRVTVDAGEMPGSIAATAVFSRKLVTVPPGQTARVDVTLTIPPKPSSRAVVILFQGMTKVPSGAMAATVSLGIVLTFTLSQNVALNPSTLTVNPPTKSSNLTVSQRCTNTGSEPIATKAILAIINRSGRLVGKSAVPERRLLPGETAEVRTEYAGDLAPGQYRALMTYDLGGKTVTSTADFSVR